jgi:ABC-type phosphate transport system permease subunit
MLAVLLLILVFILFPAYPVFAALALSGAFWSAYHWKADVGETLELFVFYGALIGCLVSWFGF